MGIPRMRTINEIIAAVKEQDSESAITAHFVRTICKQGKVHYFLAGNKMLVCLDDFLDYISKA